MLVGARNRCVLLHPEHPEAAASTRKKSATLSPKTLKQPTHNSRCKGETAHEGRDITAGTLVPGPWRSMSRIAIGSGMVEAGSREQVFRTILRVGANSLCQQASVAPTPPQL